MIRRLQLWALSRLIKSITGGQPPARIDYREDGTHIHDGYLIAGPITADPNARGSITDVHLITPDI